MLKWTLCIIYDNVVSAQILTVLLGTENSDATNWLDFSDKGSMRNTRLTYYWNTIRNTYVNGHFTTSQVVFLCYICMIVQSINLTVPTFEEIIFLES